MFMVLSSITLSILILLTLIQVTLNKFENQNNMKLSPLESGFESLSLSSLFNLQYFMLAVLFVIFDVELILLIPVLKTPKPWDSAVMVTTLLMITLVMEWYWLGLKWNF